MSRFEIISMFAGVQHGVVARYQLIEAGINPRKIESLIQSRIITSASRGIYKTIGSQSTWEQRAVIATLSCGRDGYLSHESVLMLFDLLPRDRNKISRRRFDRKRNCLIHVTTPRREYHTANVYFHRSTCLSTHDKSLQTFGIRHVSIERAIVDCAQQLTKFELDFVIDNSLSKKLITLERMKTILASLHTAPGREKVRTKEILEPYFDTKNNAVSESQLEKRIETILSDISPHKLIRQHCVIINGQKYRIDLSIPQCMIAIEVDGFKFHRSRTKFDDDRRRQNALIASNWKLARITAAFTDEEIRRTFRALLT